MKKLMMIAALAILTLASCKKDKPEPTETPTTPPVEDMAPPTAPEPEPQAQTAAPETAASPETAPEISSEIVEKQTGLPPSSAPDERKTVTKTTHVISKSKEVKVN